VLLPSAEESLKSNVKSLSGTDTTLTVLESSLRVMESFRANQTSVLITTTAATRGLDFPQVQKYIHIDRYDDIVVLSIYLESSLRVMESFRANQTSVLITTTAATRGLDFPQVIYMRIWIYIDIYISIYIYIYIYICVCVCVCVCMCVYIYVSVLITTTAATRGLDFTQLKDI